MNFQQVEGEAAALVEEAGAHRTTGVVEIDGDCAEAGEKLAFREVAIGHGARLGEGGRYDKEAEEKPVHAIMIARAIGAAFARKLMDLLITKGRLLYPKLGNR